MRLRERVYFQTVPALSGAIARRLGRNPTGADLEDAYEQVMVILFRLLFVAYAEDKDLLPYRTNDHYTVHSLKRTARRLVADRQAGTDHYDEHARSLWHDVQEVWRAVNEGNSGWGVPAYNGGLFTDDPEVSKPGAALTSLELTDAEFAPALAGLLIDEGSEGEGPVDFRSLSVREFGTIYEGLLESRLADGPGRPHRHHDQGEGTVPAGQRRRGGNRSRRVGLPAQPIRRAKGLRLLLHEAVRGGAPARQRP